ncbi:hypothetical protein D9611_010077 [Ephemerocybe angulata]|uniref:Uncharacterized protein n=1 Tax=Ephemerocybe angulata TaxID=980116 RepID=A0A8H5EVD9_9AGAR|nr:hypothetical protein D9611_010077 [Tulosesus angulatus]
MRSSSLFTPTPASTFTLIGVRHRSTALYPPCVGLEVGLREIFVEKLGNETTREGWREFELWGVMRSEERVREFSRPRRTTLDTIQGIDVPFDRRPLLEHSRTRAPAVRVAPSMVVPLLLLFYRRSPPSNHLPSNDSPSPSTPAPPSTQTLPRYSFSAASASAAGRHRPAFSWERDCGKGSEWDDGKWDGVGRGVFGYLPVGVGRIKWVAGGEV